MSGLLARHNSMNSIPGAASDSWYYWLLLLLTILLEVAGTVCMRLSDGYKNVIPSLLIFVFYVLSFGIFPFVLQHLDLSVSYAIWSALGTALTAIVGFLYFGDKMSNLKIAAMLE
mmetsp:Transcript_19835/g.25716  ORF Transcript_19835/g.25716 Transcript_19835/m.25716 type:complete len:115 (-) Transcript_19835:5-349(-)